MSIYEIDANTARRMIGKSYFDNPIIDIRNLRVVVVPYIDFEGNKKQGQIIVNQLVSQEVLEIFLDIYRSKFPIYSVKPIDCYDGDDNLSMEANNTSAFNYRYVAGTGRLSNHCYGLAIDINPVQNPYIKGERILPTIGKAFQNRGIMRKGMIMPEDTCYRAFTSRGWSWGGEWVDRIDYQHFEKHIEGINTIAREMRL